MKNETEMPQGDRQYLHELQEGYAKLQHECSTLNETINIQARINTSQKEYIQILKDVISMKDELLQAAVKKLAEPKAASCWWFSKRKKKQEEQK